MTEELDVDEVKRIARDFIMKKWNGEVAEFGNWSWSAEGVHEIEGKAKIPQRVATGQPKHLPDNAPFYETDVVNVECLFKLRVSVKDREVIGYRVEQPKPPSPNFQPEPSIVYPVGPDPMPPRDNLFDSLGKIAKADKDKAKAHYYEEKAKKIRDKRGNDLPSLARKYGIDPSRFGKR